MPVSYLQVEHLTKAVGDRVLFKDLSFGIAQGDKVALIARNGAGKSTLMDTLTGSNQADSGTVTFRNGIRVGYLPQKIQFDNVKTIQAFAETLKEKEEFLRMITQFGITDTTQSLQTLSGGQCKKVMLAKCLACKPDLLLLDEPTNHLDLTMVEWLEGYLQRASVTLLMVTHDRYFLDNVCTDILELDNGNLYACHGNYAYYLSKREERMKALSAETEKYRNLYRTELEWMRRMPQARGHKARCRIDNFQEIAERAKGVSQAGNIRLQVQSAYIGNKIFEAKNVCKHYGNITILQHFNYVFSRYERLGIIGNNGAGKTTFLKMLMGLEKPDSGLFEIGDTVRFGYYAQTGLHFRQGKKVIDIISDVAEYIQLKDKRLSASQFLQHFLFPPSQQHDFVEKLSGGEQQRLHLCYILMQQPNFLILDEPTNDLDIPTLRILEDWLQQFKGCLIVVSHDRYFMDQVVDHLFVFKGNGIIEDFPGNYTDYRLQKKNYEEQSKTAEANIAKAKPRLNENKKPKRLSFKEQKHLQEIEIAIPMLETEKKNIEQRLSGETLSAGEVQRLSQRYIEVKDELDSLELEWLELTD
ncbi:MAG TPA: ABC transporter [Bacteroidales bacterium]|nr:ABC transporter [Bacteroidales bacterium]